MENFKVVVNIHRVETIFVEANSHTEAEALAKSQLEKPGEIIHMDTISRITGEI